MSKGIVYILTNPSMPEWVKIGYSEKECISDRIKSLNASTAIPLSFRVYATLETEDAKEVEQSIHRIIDAVDSELRAIELSDTGKDRVREFFQISPEKAFLILKEIAKYKNEQVDMTTPTDDELIQERKAMNKRGRIKFKDIKIGIGTELIFLKDEIIKCVIVDDNNMVRYNNEIRSISNLASELLGYNANGNKYFLYDNETLWDRRIRLENEMSKSEE